MTKQEIIDQLNAAGVTFDPKQTKEQLLALLPGEGSAPEKSAAAAGASDAEQSESDTPVPSEPNSSATAPPLSTLPPEDDQDGDDDESDDDEEEEDDGPPSPFPRLIPSSQWDEDDQEEFEAMVAEKVRAGLSRDQAIEVIERQFDWDMQQVRQSQA
jgi:hypothetical protein